VLVALCAAGLALLNFPLLAIWDQPATVAGLPLLPVALFVIWGGLILALALASEGGGPEARDDGDDAGGPRGEGP
jgi:hypothetical protein